VLERCHRRVLKRGRGIGSADPARLHRLRIALKQLRYAAGFFAPLFPRARVAPMREVLNELQELLGSINDHATATKLIAAVGRRARGPLQPQARLVLEHWNEALLAEQRRALKPAWKTLRGCAPFWYRARTIQ
jgi:CHAD domain-containing protein